MELKKSFEEAVRASRELNMTDPAAIDALLLALADETEQETGSILEANRKDLARMERENPMYDRLLLNEDRIAGIAADIRDVAALPSPLGIVREDAVRPNGMRIRKVSVPFGVIGIIYEARPNVSFDVFSLCVKSGNACILKGGSDAHASNTAIIEVIRKVLIRYGFNPDIVTLLPPDRSATAAMLNAVDYVDLIIPRGSQGLIEFVRNNSKVPVIETGAGICHAYFDADGDAVKGSAIVNNAKTRRVSVCNSLDCLVIHRNRLENLPEICAPLADSRVIVYADPESFAVLHGSYPAPLLERATEESYGTEYLDYKMSVKTVGDIDEAIEHVTKYSSRHSETIISESPEAIAHYQKAIDAACVYANVSTAFTDGAQFGLGAEIGISTQKLHARGPMALSELTSYKYLIDGSGQIRA